MIRIRSAALGAAIPLLAACAKQGDRTSTADTSLPAAAAATTTTTADSARPAAAATADSATSATGATAGAPAAKPSADSGAKKKPAGTRTAPSAPKTPAARTGAPATTTPSAGGAARTPPSAQPTTPAPAPAAAAGAAPAASGGMVKVNRFMSYDAAAKTVTLEVIAALTSQQGGFNFNGGSNGSHVITVPEGWTVRMHFKNADAIPHSAIIILDQRPLPNAPDTPAIPRAYTSHVNDGIPPQGEDDVEFRASKAGHYLLYCGVPGHGPSGMYVRFVVAADAATPAYQM